MAKSQQMIGQSSQLDPMRCYPGQGGTTTSDAAFLLHASPLWQQQNPGNLAYPEIKTLIHP
jgi:hypothetical protein